jgi:predicted molibdopterin-dependent oxidoreductase YjgC
MSTVKIEIDSQAVEVEEGERLLWAALDAGIFIPHLCANREHGHLPASCRLCWVEISGRAAPLLSCTVAVEPGMVVRTRGEAVDRLVRSAFALIMSTHRLECAHCPGNRRCALQKIAKDRKLPLRPKRLEWGVDSPTAPAAPAVQARKARLSLCLRDPGLPVDNSHPLFGFDPNHCVLCGQCVFVCNHVTQCRVLDFHRRGLLTRVGTFQGRPLAEQEHCTHCLECVKVCPVGALFLKKEPPPG